MLEYNILIFGYWRILCQFVIVTIASLSKKYQPKTANQLNVKIAGGGVKLYHTTSFIQQLFGYVQKFSAENQQLKQELAHLKSSNPDAQSLQDKANNSSQQRKTPNRSSELNLLQTESLATAEQHLPLKNFFERQNIKPTFDYQKVNTNGFFDETAQIFGDNYKVFADILSKITWAYNKKHNGLNYDLTKLSQNHAGLINKTCRQCYEHTLFSRYSYQKANKVINLALQQAKPIQQFFLGEWLEWYILSQTLSYIEKMPQKPKFACARGVKIQFSNQDIHELDFVFFNSRAELFVIECKSGEYRQDINKYLTLRQRLNIPTQRFSLLVTDLNQTQAQSMSAMYGINFISIHQIADYVALMVK